MSAGARTNKTGRLWKGNIQAKESGEKTQSNERTKETGELAFLLQMVSYKVKHQSHLKRRKAAHNGRWRGSILQSWSVSCCTRKLEPDWWRMWLSISGCRNKRTHLAEEARVEAGEFGWHVLLIHVVEFMERSSGGEAALHQVQHGHHTYRNRRQPRRDESKNHTGFKCKLPEINRKCFSPQGWLNHSRRRRRHNFL